MKARKNKAGFTLVELMIVVVIIGILAVLAIFGVRKYMAQSKSAEALNTLGAINRSAVQAYEKESAPSEINVGKSSSQSLHSLCASSNAVPSTDAAIQNKKYGANPAANVDYHIGGNVTPATGWMCLKFEMSQAQYYRYQYTKAATPALATNVTPPGGAQFLAEARGDVNGDNTFSGFVTGGKIQNGQAVTFTEIAQTNPEE